MEKRIPSLIIGILILGSIFLAPFTYRGARPLTFYEATSDVITFLSDVQRLTPQYLPFNYIFVASFIMLVLAGLIGTYPNISGLLGTIGMASVSLGAILVGVQVTWGIGYYILWTLSIAELGIYFWYSQLARHRAREILYNILF
jgi:hypothetical protein